MVERIRRVAIWGAVASVTLAGVLGACTPGCGDAQPDNPRVVLDRPEAAAGGDHDAAREGRQDPSDSHLDSTGAHDSEPHDGEDGTDEPEADSDTEESCEPRERRCGPKCSARQTHPPYLCDETSGDSIEYPTFSEAFEMPPKGLEPKTACQMLGSIPEEYEGAKSFANTAAPQHSYSCRFPKNLYAEPSDDVTLHYGVVIDGNYEVDELEILASALVGYESVEARFIRRTPDRSEILEERRGEGVTMEASGRVLQLDVVFPSEVFDGRRMYELSVQFQIFDPDEYVQAGFYNYRLFYGSYEMPDRPCYRSPTPTRDISENIKRLLDHDHLPGTLARKTGPDSYEVVERIEAAPDEKIDLHFFQRGSGTRPGPTMITPMLDGETLDEGWRFIQPEPPPLTENEPRLTYRDELSFRVPSEPGSYRLTFPIFRAPNLLLRDLNRCDYGVSLPSHGGGIGDAFPIEVVVE